jgi:hypothetical protein
MATITTAGSGNLLSTTANAPWPSGTLPQATDTVVIAHHCTLTNGQSVTYATLQKSGTGSIACSGVCTITAAISVLGTEDGAFITMPVSMASARTIVDRIADDLVTTLETITITNGYSINLTVVRKELPSNNPTHGQCILIMDDPTEEEMQDETQRIWWQEFVALVYLINSPSTSIDEQQNLVWADVHKATQVDRTRGGLAYTTRPEAPIRFADSIAIPIRVQFATTFSDITAQ